MYSSTVYSTCSTVYTCTVVQYIVQYIVHMYSSTVYSTCSTVYTCTVVQYIVQYIVHVV